MGHERTDAARRKAWLTAALLSAAMLIVPLVGWLLVPRPAPYVPPPRARAAAAAPDTAGSAPEADLPARPAAPRPAPEARPAADVPVRGVVLDPDGNPIAGAFVGCNDGTKRSTSSDADGRFELPPDADGCMAIATQAVHNPSEPTRLTAGRDNTLRLTAGGAISGNVIDETGRPVEHYLLAIESFVPSGDDAKAGVSGRPKQIHDPAGAFLWEDLAPGRYVLTASAADRPPARSPSVEVEPGRTTHHVRIVLARGVTLVGKVVDAETHAPIEGAQIQLDAVTSSGANAVSLVLTDATGNYELEGAPPSGPFSVRVRHEAYMTKIVPGLDARGAGKLRADVELRSRGDGGSTEELAGIGATLAPFSRGVQIMGVINGGPAARAGLKGGDRIARIDGTDATELPLFDCVQRLRGPEGTRVRVGVERDGQAIEVTVEREIVVR